MLDTIHNIDANILLWIQDNIRCDWLTPIMKFITEFGNLGLIWLIASIMLICFKKTRKVGFICLISLVVNFIINNLILKNMVARIRPYEAVDGLQLLIEKQRDFSFPSGHAGSAFSVAVPMFAKLPKKFGIPTLVLAFLIAFSRLYVGVHYPSDVLVGMILGSVIGILAIIVIDKLYAIKRTKTAEK